MNVAAGRGDEDRSACSYEVKQTANPRSLRPSSVFGRKHFHCYKALQQRWVLKKVKNREPGKWAAGRQG